MRPSLSSIPFCPFLDREPRGEPLPGARSPWSDIGECRLTSRLAPYIKKFSGGLYNALKPVSGAYANAMGHRAMGLKYDDLIPEEREDMQKVNTSWFRSVRVSCRGWVGGDESVGDSVLALKEGGDWWSGRLGGLRRRSPGQGDSSDLRLTFQALARLPQKEQYDRVFRMRTAFQQSIQHSELPKSQWIKPSEVGCREDRARLAS